MPIVAYNDFSEFLKRTPAEAWPAVTLICGEEMLCRSAFDAALAHLVPGNERVLGVERFDGGEDNLGDVLSSMNTFALLTRTKLVVLHDARLFYSAKAQQDLRDKMVQAAAGGALKKAARPFLNLLALCGLGYEDLASPTLRRKIVPDVDGEPPAWLDPLVAHCRDKGLRVPEKKDDAEALKDAMDKGFPEGHRLLITTDFVDRRKALFKAIEVAGVVVDCAVPKGESRSDRMAQEAVMQATLDAALIQAGKTMRTDARQRLMAWTGFDLRMLTGNLEKLISFVGDRKTIADTDVTSVLQRTRKDPIFEFTRAVAERNLPDALVLMQRLLDDEMHPLQILAALANQLRRLLMAKVYIVGDGGRTWSPQLSFPQFKTAAFKAVQEADQGLNALLQSWETLLDPSSGARKDKAFASSDLVVVKNAKSPFPVFQTLKHADDFSLEDLRSGMVHLSEIDLQMKSTRQAPRLLLETFLMRLCRGTEGKSVRKG